MIVSINIALPNSSASLLEARPKLPPQLAQLGDKDSDELVLIELQGELEVTGQKNGQVVGQLNFDNPSKPTLMIGHNLLEGKMATLNKPLAVLRRTGATPSLGPSDSAVTDVDDAPTGKETPSWDMVALVKRKVVFAKRPMPIVGLANATVNGTSLG